MEFVDIDIDALNIANFENFTKLIIQYLCGKINPSLQNIQEKKGEFEEIINYIQKNGLNYEQFNEILLLLNENRIDEGFYEFFFKVPKNKKITFELMKKGITRFRGYCFLNYGNIRNTFKVLLKMNKEQIEKELVDYITKTPEKIKDEFINRPLPIIDLEIIDKDKTWYIGYLSRKKLKKELVTLQNLIENDRSKERYYESFYEELLEMAEEAHQISKKGEKNTNSYLIWDYMDVYIATSMRNKCDFQETHDFVKTISNHPKVLPYSLRIFDPTRAHTDLSRNKGLIEGLMLKRAKCTIYMVQESDTMGKDSELASTLAQKKPVIAYIPTESIDTLTEKIKNYELDEIIEKIYFYKSKRLFKHTDVINKIDEDIDIQQTIEDFLNAYEKYRNEQQFSLWSEKEQEFKENFPSFDNLCIILASAIKIYYDKREEILKESHPLGMQIDLSSGVANGVLIVRDIEKYVDLLLAILNNSLEFKIESSKGFTGMYEKISGSLYRLITHDETLTNSFWTFFYKK